MSASTQLCSRCGYRCRRTLNTCPVCDPWTGRLALIRVLLAESNLEPIGDPPRKHLIAKSDKAHGYFLVGNENEVLNRTAFREICSEARKAGCVAPFFIWCRIASYTGPGMEVMQITKEQREAARALDSKRAEPGDGRIKEIFRLAEQLVGRGEFDIHVWGEEKEEVIVEYCGMQAWFDRDGFAVLQTEVSSAATIPGLCEFASICDRLNKWIQATGATQ